MGGHPPKTKSICAMCDSMDSLQYVLPSPNGNKEFCSTNCIAEFRKEHVKNECAVCNYNKFKNTPVKPGNRDSTKTFCTPTCLNVHRMKEQLEINIKDMITNHFKNIKPHVVPESSTPDEITLVPEESRVTEHEMEAATSTISTEGPSILPSNPANWTVEDVIQHIICEDVNLKEFATLFRNHAIDGEAFLLLTLNTMMKYLGIKLGPSMKLQIIINNLKSQKG